MAKGTFRPLIVVVSSAGIAIGAWFLLFPLITETPPNASSITPESINEDKKASIIAQFDANGDGIVEWSEFENIYGKKEVITDFNGKKFTAEQAFRIHDLNNDRVLDGRDEKLKDDIRWANFQKSAKKEGFDSRKFNDKFYRLNDVQLFWFCEIEASLEQNNWPWQGKLVDRKYFENWSRVVDKNGKAALGFYTIVDDTNARLLKGSGSIRVCKRADVVVSKVADAPQDEYAQRVRKLQVNDVDGNLELADDCMKWGFDKTARQLYQRVLVFDFKNGHALKALNLDIENNQYKEVK